jgi:HEAT repeat protein
MCNQIRALLLPVIVAVCVGAGPRDKSTKEYIPEDTPPDVKELIEKTFSNDHHVRAEAAEKLGEMGPRAASAVPALIELLSDHDGQRMVHVEQPRGVGYKTTFVCNVACSALAKIGEPAVEPCLAALKERLSVKGRCDVIRVLGELNDPRATGVLVELIKDPNPEIRQSAMLSLNDCSSDASVIPALTVGLKDVDNNVRCFAAMGLANVRDPMVVDPLIEALSDPDNAVSRRAAAGLGKIANLRAVAALIDLAENQNKSALLRADAVRALGMTEDPRANELFLALVKDTSVPAPVRSAAVIALGHSGNPGVADLLIGILNSSEKPKDYREFGALGSEPLDLRASAAEALKSLGEGRALVSLTQVAKGSGPMQLRFQAALAAVKLANGAIDDVDVVAAIGKYNAHCLGDELYRDEKREALDLIVSHGKTRAVRAGAREIIWQKWHEGVPRACYQALSALYFLIAITCWVLWNGEYLKRRQFTLMSLLVLTAIIALGLPILIPAIGI